MQQILSTKSGQVNCRVNNTHSHINCGEPVTIFSNQTTSNICKAPHIPDVCENWFRIGRKLGLGAETLNEIGEGDDGSGKLETVLREWSDLCGGEVNLAELYQVLKTLKHGEAASKCQC